MPATVSGRDAQQSVADVLTRCGYELIDAADRFRTAARSVEFAEKRVGDVEAACIEARAAVRGRG